MMPMNPMLPPSVDPNSSPGIFEEDDDELFEPADFPDFDEQDDTEWGVVSEKCKVVSEDGISIKNCTDSNKNPYAGTPVNPPRVQRQAAMPYYPQQMMPAPIYYVMPQPMYQPVYYPPPRQQKNSDYYEDNSGPDDSQIYNENTKFHKRHQTIQDDY